METRTGKISYSLCRDGRTSRQSKNVQRGRLAKIAKRLKDFAWPRSLFSVLSSQTCTPAMVRTTNISRAWIAMVMPNHWLFPNLSVGNETMKSVIGIKPVLNLSHKYTNIRILRNISSSLVVTDGRVRYRPWSTEASSWKTTRWPPQEERRHWRSSRDRRKTTRADSPLAWYPTRARLAALEG